VLKKGGPGLKASYLAFKPKGAFPKRFELEKWIWIYKIKHVLASDVENFLSYKGYKCGAYDSLAYFDL